MRLAWVLATTAWLIGCGGSSAPAGPSPSGSGSSTDAASVTIDGATINFAAGVSSADRDLITRFATASRNYFRTAFGRTTTGHVTVNVGSGTGPMQAQDHTITLSLGEQSWAARSSIGRAKTVAHEFFHVLQGEGGWTFQPLQWLFEGAAEYAGYAIVVDQGLTTYQAVRACEIDIYYVGGGANATPPLNDISFLLSSSINSRYAVAWLGIDHLVGGINSIGALRGMWERSGSMEERFTSAFGRSSQAFSAEFQNHRLTYPNNGGNPCNGF